MKFDSSYIGPQGFSNGDGRGTLSRFANVKEALFRNPYYFVWGADGEPPLPVYEVTLGRALRGLLPGGRAWQLKAAAARTLDSDALLRWGPDHRGFRRIIHPNGIALFGRWIIDQETNYSGYFQQHQEGLIIGRYSTCCSETRTGYYRSLSLVGSLFPVTDPEHPDPVPTASFITQEDIGGARTPSVLNAVLRNAPNVSPWRRGLGAPILLLTGIALRSVDRQPTIRQLYEIAELMKPPNKSTNSPTFMQLTVAPQEDQKPGNCPDFRDEILELMYDPGDPEPKRKLVFNIEVTDHGYSFGKLIERRVFRNWKKIGRIEFTEAVASYNADFVFHAHHPPWRTNKDDPQTAVRGRDRS